jgi:hypothetical protein
LSIFNSLARAPADLVAGSRRHHEPRHDGIVVARLHQELAVHVHDIHPGPARQAGADQDVVQGLGVAVEDERASILGRQVADEVGEDRGARSRIPAEHVEGRGEREVVQVPEHDHVRLGIRGQNLVDEGRTMAACCLRWISEIRMGGWEGPNSPWSPPFELKWLATTNPFARLKRKWATSGFRLAAKASPPARLGSRRRPGLCDSVGPGPTMVAVTASPDVPGTSRTRSVR